MNPFKKIIFYSAHLLFVPHILSFFLCKQRNIIKEDIKVLNQRVKVNYGDISSLVFHLIINAYYRNIFYNRIGWLHIFCFYLPKAKDFYPCKNIGGGVFPAHSFSTILNAKSIGRNFSCRQCTTIGNKRDGDGINCCPVIGDNVSVGANVCIIGDISIGNNVIIGAGSVVVKDVPDNVIVAGNPARIIKELSK